MLSSVWFVIGDKHLGMLKTYLNFSRIHVAKGARFIFQKCFLHMGNGHFIELPRDPKGAGLQFISYRSQWLQSN